MGEAGGWWERQCWGRHSEIGGEMDTKQEVLTRLQQIISEQLAIQPEEISEKSTWTQLGADSLDRLGMSLAIENAFKMEIPHQVGERLNTVGETVDHLLTLSRLQQDERMPAPLNLNAVGRGL